MKAQDRLRFPVGLAALVICVLLAAGCMSTGGSGAPAPTAGPVGGLDVTSSQAGRISVTGSTTVLPIAQALAEGYMVLNPGADVQISAGGSSVGITSVGEGTADIGMSSRDLKDTETADYPRLRPVAIAKDGIVMIVNPVNGIPHLSFEEVRGIYAGGVTNWRQVGGADRPIVAIGRDSASGTREFFNGKVMGTEPTTKLMLEKNSNGAIQVSVASNPNAIGYIGFGYVDPTVRPVDLLVNGTAVSPTVGNVLDGAYPLARELYLVTNGEPAGLPRDFIAFALSSKGQRIVQEQGFVPITGK